ncbi:30S ribosomal protein S16 [Spiroplasma litorale]|uniref:Small ribosomal subunit protein bS16 n=1 Tax=Spiroplasma litorale TaxID=216942 RepID=A0A0K1W259_9MOLU|nr:30S ribosomal protein S16 [Spiroplasma litorale]AKX34415.1 30S ribosomal protein S16 [Spiroplasma litorale]
MVKLRLKRAGKKRAAFYRIVASDSRVKRDGEYIELVGTYNPINGEVNLQNEIALKWLKNGAQPTDTVRSILSKNGIMKELHDYKIALPKDKESAPKKESKSVKKPATAKTATKSTAAKPATAKTATKSTAAKPATAKTATKSTAAKPATAKTATSKTKKEDK